MYTINVEKLYKIKEKMYNLIKEEKSYGINENDLYNKLNQFINPQEYMITKDLIYYLLDDLYKRCLIYRSSPYRFNAF